MRSPGAIRRARSLDLPNLEAIFSLGAGVDHLFDDAALPDCRIVRVVDPDLTERMSEWVVMHALVHLRQLRRYEHQQRERVWADDDDQPKAAEVQVGMLGLGVLGADAALKLGALGFRVAGWSASQKSLPGVAGFHGPDGLDRLLAITDMLIVLLPLTDATRGMIDASLLSQAQAGRPARRPRPHQRRTRRPAGRSRHPRRARFRAPQRRVARRVRARALAAGVRASGPTPPSMSAPTTRRSRRPKPSPPSSPARSRRMNAARRSAISSIGGADIEAEGARRKTTSKLLGALFCSNTYW